MMPQKPRNLSTFNLSVLEQRGRQTSRWWECVWTDIREEKIANWREICRNRDEWMKAVEGAKIHL
jgi:hypothetical protein